jgi:RNA polymerase sigma factor (sigma-70 family)
MPDNIHAPLRPLAPTLDTLRALGATPASVANPASLAGDLNSRFAAARPRLARLARLTGASADQAEDIAQETLLTAWRSLDHLRAADRFDAWLDGICRNIARRVARQSASEQERLAPDLAADTLAEDAPQDALDQIAAADADPLDTLSRQELVALLDSALGHLNVAAREAVSLRYLADLPSDETAARLGLTINTLEARLSRARKQLRAALNGPLRERAVECGLALAPADEAGWRDSRLWCHFCGRVRMQGILEANADGSGRMLLRCPLCWREHGVMETSIPSAQILSGLTSFKPAMKRLIRIGAESMAPALLRESMCFLCGAPIRARVVKSGELPEVCGPEPAEHFFVVSTCPKCELHITGAASIAGLGSPEIKRFILEHERFIIEPETLATYQSSPAIRFSLYDLPSGERLIYFADPQTLALRGVASS